MHCGEGSRRYIKSYHTHPMRIRKSRLVGFHSYILETIIASGDFVSVAARSLCATQVFSAVFSRAQPSLKGSLSLQPEPIVCWLHSLIESQR